MGETLRLLLSSVAGAGLGTLFFGGLWWTVRRSIYAKHPALWISGSLALRMSGVLVGFYLVATDHWTRLIACLLGFIVGRALVTRLTRDPEQPERHSGTQASHAP